MSELVRDGVSIYYEERGQGNSIFLTHGFVATGDMWFGQAEMLTRSHRLITWDMRGHGRTSSPELQAKYSEAETVADMVAIMDAAGVEEAIVGGHSLGGYMALAFHFAHPKRVSALILQDTGPGYKNPGTREQWNGTARERALDFENRGLAAMGKSGETLIANHRSPIGIGRAARGMLAQFDARIINSLPDIAVPTLIIVGENDTPYLAGSAYMEKKIPRARQVVISDAGHAANIDQPTAWEKAVGEFLAELG
ncbi:MAG TPA: alpha/beta fold hydrolase [Dehalococcoidia bacterium]|nr:alpha/beta fold hydrolase [Dehalococcoidia bacterium]